MQPIDWRARYRQQAGWTRELRRYLYNKAGLQRARRILEVGCGPGAILEEMSGLTPAGVHGLDIDLDSLREIDRGGTHCALTCGNGLSLPLSSRCFDVVYSHFFLMWVTDPLRAVREMARVTRPGGWVLALAEPDYGGRIDHPQEMVRIGRLQAESLRRQGADPETGRRLAGLFIQAGLAEVRTGVIGGEWAGPEASAGLENEWQVIQNDLRGLIEPAEIERLRQLDEQSWRDGSRVLYVPVFYAAGRVPD